MKKLICILTVAFLVFSCISEKIHHPSESEVPTAENYIPVVTVDQETNQVTFALESGVKAVIPVWMFQDKKGEYTQYSACNGLKKIFTTAGDYTVRMKIMNASGLSADYVDHTFHIDNTLVNFDKYFGLLAGGTGESNTKEWRIAKELEAHMGCGPEGTTGTEWWKAQPNEKEAFGVYADRITFGGEGYYKYYPGEDGMTYVNVGVTAEPYAPASAETADFNVAVETTETTFNFEVVGEDLFIVLPEKTPFPYIPGDDFVAAPRLRIEAVTAKQLDLVADLPGISWHFILTSGEGKQTFKGFKYDAPSNLWLPADAEGAHTFHQWYAPGWNEIASPEITDGGNGVYSFTCPVATTDQWQNQFFIIPSTDLPLESAKTYDFSVLLTASTDIAGATLKVTDATDDGNFLFTERTPLTAFEETVFYLVDVPGIDAAAVKMVFDFGGNGENCEITIKHIVIKDHAVDDGTVIPEPEPEPVPDPVDFVSYNDPANLWLPVDAEGAHTFSQYYAPGWAQLPNPEVTEGNGTYSFTLDAATSERWQCQFFVIPSNPLTLEATKNYDYKVIIKASNDVPAATCKLVDVSDDGNFLFDMQFPLAANEETVIIIPDKAGIDASVKMVFDFAPNPANTEIEIKQIILQEHRGPVELSWDTPGNLWASTNVTVDHWYSAGDWSGGLHPTIDESDAPRKYVITVPEGIGGAEWQGQTKFLTEISASADKQYHFAMTVNGDVESTITVKLAWTGNDNDHAFFYEGAFQVPAGEDVQFTKLNIAPDTDYDKVVLFVDLGRTPGGTDVTLKDFVLVEVQ